MQQRIQRTLSCWISSEKRCWKDLQFHINVYFGEPLLAFTCRYTNTSKHVYTYTSVDFMSIHPPSCQNSCTHDTSRGCMNSEHWPLTRKLPEGIIYWWCRVSLICMRPESHESSWFTSWTLFTGRESVKRMSGEFIGWKLHFDLRASVQYSGAVLQYCRPSPLEVFVLHHVDIDDDNSLPARNWLQFRSTKLKRFVFNTTSTWWESDYTDLQKVNRGEAVFPSDKWEDGYQPHICLFNRKPQPAAHSQNWGNRPPKSRRNVLSITSKTQFNQYKKKKGVKICHAPNYFLTSLKCCCQHKVAKQPAERTGCPCSKLYYIYPLPKHRFIFHRCQTAPLINHDIKMFHIIFLKRGGINKDPTDWIPRLFRRWVRFISCKWPTGSITRESISFHLITQI